jgi:hypothetical protein
VKNDLCQYIYDHCRSGFDVTGVFDTNRHALESLYHHMSLLYIYIYIFSFEGRKFRSWSSFYEAWANFSKKDLRTDEGTNVAMRKALEDIIFVFLSNRNTVRHMDRHIHNGWFITIYIYIEREITILISLVISSTDSIFI